MVVHDTIDRGRLSRWAFIVLLLFAVAFVIHTHVNTTLESNIISGNLPVKLASRPRVITQTSISNQQLLDSNIQSGRGSLFEVEHNSNSLLPTEAKLSTMVEQFAAKVVEGAADVSSVMNLFKPSEETSHPGSFEEKPNSVDPSPIMETSLKHAQEDKDSLDHLSNHSTVVKKDEQGVPTNSRISFLHNAKSEHPSDVHNRQVNVAVKSTDSSLSRIAEQAISFLDPVIHGHQIKPAFNSARAQASKPKTVEKKDDGRITFLDTNHADLQKQLKPGKQKRAPTKKREEQQDEDLARIKAENNHPRVSPRLGTDISLENHMSLLLCPNQAKCIMPELQLQKKLKIYLCKHPTRHGVRFYYLAREGLMLHPNVELVSESAIETADFIMYLPGSAPWHLTEIRNVSFAKRLIVLDEFDGHTLFSPGYPREEHTKYYGGPSAPWYYMYFKRSYVRRLDGIFTGYPHLIQHEVYPLTYSIAEVYIPKHFNTKREIEILCTLRGSKSMTTRLRVQNWVSEYGKKRNVQNIISGEVNTATRTTVSKQYFEQMFNAQIIVTVNPANWEGDFRLWEAMCTGALIFVDPVFVPHPYPLEDKVHVVFFSNTDQEDLYRKLDYYRANPLEARKIAVQGYLHAMKYHRTVTMMDYILRTAHLRRVAMEEDNAANLPNYAYTGQYLHYEAKVQEKYIKACHRPGIFQPPLYANQPIKRLNADCLKELKTSNTTKDSAGHIDKPLQFLH